MEHTARPGLTIVRVRIFQHLPNSSDCEHLQDIAFWDARIHVAQLLRADRLFTPTVRDTGGSPPRCSDAPNCSAPDRRARHRACPPRSPTRTRTATPAPASCSSSPPRRSARRCKAWCRRGALPRRRTSRRARGCGSPLRFRSSRAQPRARRTQGRRGSGLRTTSRSPSSRRGATPRKLRG